MVVTAETTELAVLARIVELLEQVTLALDRSETHRTRADEQIAEVLGRIEAQGARTNELLGDIKQSM